MTDEAAPWGRFAGRTNQPKGYQPMLSDVSLRQAPWSQEVALETMGAHAAQRGPLLPVLHALQERFGFVDARAVPLVAKALNVSRADVYGVLTCLLYTSPSPRD